MRPDLDTYFMNITKEVATRATCKRHNVGAIAVRDKHILATGYNGAPSGLKDCLELGCLRDAENIPSGKQIESCRAVHSEMNVIIQVGLHSISIEGATIYCTHSPCRTCAKMLVNAHIKEFVYETDYADTNYEDIFTGARIPVRRLR